MSNLKRYTVTSLKQSDVRPQKQVIKNLIVGDTVSLLSADPKMGKTTMAVQMAYDVSKGIDFLDLKTSKISTAYIFLDDSPSNIKQRLDKTEYEDNENLFLYFPQIDGKTISFEELIAQIKQDVPSLGFVIIDMLNDIRPVDTKTEYSNNEIKKYIRFLEAIAVKEEIAILVLHHNGKSQHANVNNKALGGIQLTGAINGAILTIVRPAVDSEFATLTISGRNVQSNRINLHHDKNKMKFERAEDDIIDINQDLVKIINFITAEKGFVGTVQQLSSLLKLSTSNPRILGKYISENENALLENGIILNKRKSNGVRLLELTLDPKYDYDANLESLSKTEPPKKEKIKNKKPEIDFEIHADEDFDFLGYLKELNPALKGKNIK